MTLLNFKLLNIEFAYIATHLCPCAPTYLIKSSLHVLDDPHIIPSCSLASRMTKLHLWGMMWNSSA